YVDRERGPGFVRQHRGFGGAGDHLLLRRGGSSRERRRRFRGQQRFTGQHPRGSEATGAEAPVARARAGAAGRNDPAVRRPLRAVRHQNVAVGQDRRTRRQTIGKAAGLATGRKGTASARPTRTAGAARHTGATGPTGPVRTADPGRIRRDRPARVPRRRGGTRVVVTGPAGEAVAGPLAATAAGVLDRELQPLRASPQFAVAGWV